ncbi:MAG: universal stress protein [Gemmatimonadota bacterium]
MSGTSSQSTSLAAPPAAPFARVLLATDATHAADGAVRVAAALAERHHAQLSVFSVVEPAPYPLPLTDLALAPSSQPAAELELLAQRREAVQQQFARLNLKVPPDVEVERTEPLGGILYHSDARHAELIVLGLGRHAILDRIFGTETALHAVRDANVPVLAVPEPRTAAPHHVLVGTDFDASSVAAARAAARLVGPHGRITLAHVDAVADPLPAMLADWPPHVLDRLNDAFARMIAQLALPDTLEIDSMPLAGVVGTELVACAERLHVDAIVLGRHTRSLVERMVLGSATTSVVRHAHCGVMVVPREA